MILKKKFRLQFRGEKTKHFDIHYAHLAAKKKKLDISFQEERQNFQTFNNSKLSRRTPKRTFKKAKIFVESDLHRTGLARISSAR
jgi:hypothetical protein